MTFENRAEDLIARIHWRRWGEAIVHALCSASRYPTRRDDPAGERAIEAGLVALESFADKPTAGRDRRAKIAQPRGITLRGGYIAPWPEIEAYGRMHGTSYFPIVIQGNVCFDEGVPAAAPQEREKL